MNFKKYLPTLVAGFGAAVLSTVPGIKNFSCNLIVPAAASISILLEKKINNDNKKYALKKGIGFGLLTSFFATFFITFFEAIMTFVTKTNALVENLSQLEIEMRLLEVPKEFNLLIEYSRKAVSEIEKTGFSFYYIIMLFIALLLANSIFGMIGGAFGVSLANRKSKEENF